MKSKGLLILLLFSCSAIFGQELYTVTEPASTIPKGVIGIRVMYETYQEVPSSVTRYRTGLRLMYGISPKLTLQMTASVSNHHAKKFPADLRNYFINHHQKGFKPNPALFEGFHGYGKFRIFSRDGEKKHLRIALFADGSLVFVPHDQAEPQLLGENSGIGAGIIATRLYKRFAASFTGGFTHPFLYKDYIQKITFHSGDAISYNISFGYRVYPKKYSNYQTINVNFYLEFLNKTYKKAHMKLNGKPFDFEEYRQYDRIIYNGLQRNSYSEIRPSIQVLLNSNSRFDIGMAQHFLGKSYLHFYPLFFINFQKYIYPQKRRLAKSAETD